MEIEIIGTLLAVVAVLVMVVARSMAAVDMGITVNTNNIYHGGGDPAMVYLTAGEAITPGDNCQPSGTQLVYMSDTGASPSYIGTADKNDNAALDDNNAMTHDFASGEIVGIITGHCHVRKIADTNGATAGKVQRVGATDAAEVEDNASTMKYSVGRALTTATSGNAFILNQWG